MELQHLGVVHLIDVIARKNDNILGSIAVDEIDILVDSVGSTGVPVGICNLLVRRQHIDTSVDAVQVPRLSVAQVFVELQWLILGQYADRIDAGVDTVGQWKVDDAIFSSKRHCRLGNISGQRIQTAALSAARSIAIHSFLTIILILLL